MGNSLDHPITEKDSLLVDSSTGLTIGVSGMQGWRVDMEDDHINQDIPSKPDHVMLAIFDGHAGDGAAHYAAKNLIGVLEATDEWKKYVETGANKVDLLGSALYASFEVIDDKIFEHQKLLEGTDVSGCTANVAVITPNHIVCANAGDSRCVLGTNASIKHMSEDHKPTNPLERKRIYEAGGTVHAARVDGDLAVSRAFGDFVYKNQGMPFDKKKVSAEPDIVIHERVPDDDFLLLACDGLWDVMTNMEAVAAVREYASSNPVKYIAQGSSAGDGKESNSNSNKSIEDKSMVEQVVDTSRMQNMKEIAENMIDLALNKGSRDNISAIVVDLRAMSTQ